MCEICTNQYQLMATEFDSAMKQYRKDLVDGTAREGLAERVHDLAMLFMELNHPTFIAWMAAIGLEHLTALREQGVEFDIATATR